MRWGVRGVERRRKEKQERLFTQGRSWTAQGKLDSEVVLHK